MAWIRMLEREEADGELGVLYDKLAPKGEPLDNVLKIHTLHPRSLSDHYELYKTLMHRPGPLSRRERELVAVAVSSANQCHY